MENLVRYFNQFPLETQLNVKTISIDMYAPYIEVIRIYKILVTIQHFPMDLLKGLTTR